MISRLSRMKTKVIIYAWRHAISLVHITQQPIYFTFSFLIMLYILLLHSHNAKRLVLKVDLEFMLLYYSPVKIRYLEPLTGNFF